MAMRRLPSKDARLWLKRLVKDFQQVRIAVVAAGALADPDAMPFLIDQMKTPAMARVAGESFSLITGADLASTSSKAPSLKASNPARPRTRRTRTSPWTRTRTSPGPIRARTEVVAGPSGGLCQGDALPPRPADRGGVDPPGPQGGLPAAARAAALELAILNPGRPLFEVRAPGFRQQRLLT